MATTLPRRSHQKRPPPSTLEHLLIFQAVYELGNTSFAAVWHKITTSSLFAQEYCPALSSKDACQKIYNQLMSEHGVDAFHAYPQGARPKAKEHFAIAQACFASRVHELRASITDEERRSEELHKEIEEIRSGQWDDRISAEQREAAASTPTASSSGNRRGRPTKAEKERRDRAAAVKAAQEEASTSLGVVDPDHEHDHGHEADHEGEHKGEGEGEQETTDFADVNELAAESSLAAEEAAMDIDHSATAVPQLTIDEEPPEEKERGEKRKRESASPAHVGQQAEERGHAQEEAGLTVDPPAKDERSKKRARTEELEKSPSLTPVPPGQEMDAAARKRFKSSMTQILSQIDLDSAAGFFRVPVQPHEAPAYHSLIHHPLDLKTVSKRVREGKISSSLEFRRDLLLMIANAVMFNKPDTDVAQDGQKLFEIVESLVHVFEASDSLS